MLQIYPLCRRVSDWRHFPEWLGILSRVVCHHGWQKILPGHCRHLCKTALLKLFLLRNREGWENVGNTFCLKGKLGNFFYWLKVFIGPKLREVSTGNFHRKAPKWAKKRVKVSKIDQIRPPLHSTYCGNPPILSSELLWESINSFIRPAVGIHFLAISASDLLWESTNSFIGAAVGIHMNKQLCYV